MGKQIDLQEQIAEEAGERYDVTKENLIANKMAGGWTKPFQDAFTHLLKVMHKYEAYDIIQKEWHYNFVYHRYNLARVTADVNTKAGMYEGLLKGLFGNRQVIFDVEESQYWLGSCDRTTDHEFETERKKSPYPLWALRYKEPGYRQWSCYDLLPENVWWTYKDWCAEGADPTKFNLTPMMPDDKIVVQGEIARSDQFGWIFRVSHMKRPMNISLGTDQHHHTGPGYWLYLKQVMDDASYQELQILFERYPNATVEFSTYSINVGDCPGRNTLIWEVRNY